ncbi:RluA family pseudouridine synthase [Paenibacillus sp. YN15]|uniref:RluA family pseudouridine synthase n=1 Tax=Paenibacillus sp. YN15 TaxID=1742774 RepID=UPI000DCC020A|nr:RNA pseudouridine synthase [Paenibacillus sp. YN15]
MDSPFPEEAEELDELQEESGELALTVESEFAGQRIDKYVNESMDTVVSRTQIQNWIKDGHVLVNGFAVKSNYKVAEGNIIAVTVPKLEETEIAPEPMGLDIVYEDSHVIVVNKPRGLVVHPAAGHYTGTLVNGLLHHCKDLSGINGKLRPGIVHRIDKDTSGLIMAAKNDQAHQSLAQQLKDHTVTRKYIAVVHGVVPHDMGTVDAPIGRDSYDRKLFTVTEKNSRHAVTHFTVTERLKEFSVLELKLETGRTHQIRVHMKYIGYPLVGDPFYGKSRDKEMKGQALHAAVLGFVHPVSGEYLEFSAPLPEDMRQLLERLRMS